jgi:hypothetical protein
MMKTSGISTVKARWVISNLIPDCDALQTPTITPLGTSQPHVAAPREEKQEAAVFQAKVETHEPEAQDTTGTTANLSEKLQHLSL